MILPNELIFFDLIHVYYTCFNIVNSKNPCTKASPNLSRWLGLLVSDSSSTSSSTLEESTIGSQHTAEKEVAKQG